MDPVVKNGENERIALIADEVFADLSRKSILLS